VPNPCVLTIDSEEAACNLYGFLRAFASADNGLCDDPQRAAILRWMNVLEHHIPDIRDLLDREGDPDRASASTATIRFDLELDDKEGKVMLRVCEAISKILATPKHKDSWVASQGQLDYESASESVAGWLDVLEGRREMIFRKTEVEKLLADTGRMCCLCRTLHSVQVHHIVPRNEGGSDDIDNAISLCPNCHDEVHGRQHYVQGRTTRTYTPTELKLHRERTIELASKATDWSPGNQVWTLIRQSFWSSDAERA